MFGQYTVALDDFTFDVHYKVTELPGTRLDPPERSIEILEIIPDPAVNIGTSRLVDMAGGEDQIYRDILESIGG